MHKIRTLVVDDHAIARVGLVSLLETEEAIDVIGQAEDGESAVETALRLKPDVIIMDLVMPKLDGVAATRKIITALPETKVLILTTFSDSEGLTRALEAGATGALMKNVEITDLIDTIRQVAEGKRSVAPEIDELIAENPPLPELSPRQKEILHSITRGLTNKDIACQLGITINGVKDHVNLILAKIGAANRAEAVAIALRKHLLKI